MRRIGPRDSIAGRLALTIMLAISATAALYLLFISTAGIRARPSLSNMGLFEQTVAITRIMSAAPASLRPRLAIAAGTLDFQVGWSPTMRNLPELEESATIRDRMRRLLGDPECHVMIFKSPATAASARHDRIFGSAAFGMVVSLDDGSWLIFKLPRRLWGMHSWQRDCLVIGFVLLSTVTMSLLAARSLARPIEAFAVAVRRFGFDPNAPPIEEKGPQELRAAIAAFNAMQMQIQRFITDRTDMLAAISHDLRTPLTRVRLRGEFISDPEQQRCLFRDVGEMQAMIDAALALFHDELTDEQSTDFDLSELVRVVVDDLADQKKSVRFIGVDHVIHHGRPFALKRVFEDIIGNACIYGKEASITVGTDRRGTTILVQDIGPGIPEPLLETVFSPVLPRRAIAQPADGRSRARPDVRANDHPRAWRRDPAAEPAGRRPGRSDHLATGDHQHVRC